MMADFDDLLLRTSRTFGLAIPLLEEPFRQQLTLAYLLFRVADTLEDAERCPPDERGAALADLGSLIRRPDPAQARSLAARWACWQPSGHAGYLDLLEELPALMQAIGELPEQPRRTIAQHAARTVEGMSEFVRSADAAGNLQLQSIGQLRDYCYAVAGIVGELITELVLDQLQELQAVGRSLRQRSALFGEALQLVNILKDADDDALQGRAYLPRDVPRQQIFALAQRDLQVADEYVAILHEAGAGHGLVPFTRLPVRLAHATLERIEREGSGAKLTRQEVAGILQEVDSRFRFPSALPDGLRQYAHGLKPHIRGQQRV